jgi:hypothetical protein
MQKFKADKTPPFVQASVDRAEGIVGMEEESPDGVSEPRGRGISGITERQRQAEARWPMQEREEAVQGLRPIPFATVYLNWTSPNFNRIP